MARGNLSVLLLLLAFPIATGVKEKVFRGLDRSKYGMVMINQGAEDHFREASGLALRGHKTEFWPKLCDNDSCKINREKFTETVKGEGARYHEAVVTKLLFENREMIPNYFHETFAHGYSTAMMDQLDIATDIYWENLDLDKDGVLQKEELDEACTVALARPDSLEQDDTAAAHDAMKFMCSDCSKGLTRDKDYQVAFMNFRQHNNKCGF